MLSSYNIIVSHAGVLETANPMDNIAIVSAEVLVNHILVKLGC